VAPGAQAERLAKLYISAVDATNNDKRLAGVAVEIVPERGPSQECQTRMDATCEPSWVLPGFVTVTGTKVGYQEAVVKLPPSPSFSHGAILKLAPTLF
jgi:hypothetical protein